MAPDIADRRLRIAAARADYLRTGERAKTDVTDVVAASWERSVSAGVDEHAFSVTHFVDLDLGSRLARCAGPVLDRLMDEAADLPLSIALTDNRARVLRRLDTSATMGRLLDNVSLAPGYGYAEDAIGTNGVGTALESGQSVHVVGAEHFVAALQPFACAGAPIRDPLTGRIEGVLDLSCLAEHSSPIMHSIVRSAALNIEHNLLLDRSLRSQALFDSYVRADSRTRDAVMAIGPSGVILNASAQQLFTAEEQTVLQEHALFLMTNRSEADDRVELDCGKVVRIRGTRINVGGETAGTVVVLSLVRDQSLATKSVFDDNWLPPTSLPASGVATGPSLAKASAPYVSVMEGRTPAWRAAVQGIETGVRQGEPFLALGDTGSGKFTLVTEVFHAVVPNGRCITVNAADLNHVAEHDWSEALAATTLPTLHVLRNIDQLDTEGVVRVEAFIVSVLESGAPVNVSATLSDTSLDSDLPFHELLPYFQRAVTVPPLRHRSADLTTIVERVLSELAPHREVRLTPEAMQVLTRYSWPRNIMQLREALQHALLRRPVGAIEATDLPGYCHTTSRSNLTTIEQAERDAIITALREADGNRVRAAQSLGLARSSLYRKLKRYGITTL